jgi:hypothetical protein
MKIFSLFNKKHNSEEKKNSKANAWKIKEIEATKQEIIREITLGNIFLSEFKITYKKRLLTPSERKIPLNKLMKSISYSDKEFMFVLPYSEEHWLMFKNLETKKEWGFTPTYFDEVCWKNICKFIVSEQAEGKSIETEENKSKINEIIKEEEDKVNKKEDIEVKKNKKKYDEDKRRILKMPYHPLHDYYTEQDKLEKELKKINEKYK